MTTEQLESYLQDSSHSNPDDSSELPPQSYRESVDECHNQPAEEYSDDNSSDRYCPLSSVRETEQENIHTEFYQSGKKAQNLNMLLSLNSQTNKFVSPSKLVSPHDFTQEFSSDERDVEILSPSGNTPATHEKAPIPFKSSKQNLFEIRNLSLFPSEEELGYNAGPFTNLSGTEFDEQSPSRMMNMTEVEDSTFFVNKREQLKQNRSHN